MDRDLLAIADECPVRITDPRGFWAWLQRKHR